MSDDLREAGLRRTKMIELFDLARRGVELEFRVLAPATVTKFLPPAPGPYGPLPAMVEVQIDHATARPGRPGDIDLTSTPPEVFKPVSGALDGRGELVGPYPLLTCPVDWGGTPGMWGPREHLLPGTGGKVVFTDRALGRWLVSSLGVLPVDPGEGATHGENLCDAVFEPGLRSGPKTLLGPASVPAPGEGAVLGPEDGTAELGMGPVDTHLTTTAPTLLLDALAEIKGGLGAVSFAAKADLVEAVFNLLSGIFSAWVPVPGDGGAALKTALAPWIAASKAVAAIKFKVE